MKIVLLKSMVVSAALAVSACSSHVNQQHTDTKIKTLSDDLIGRVEVFTVPLDPSIHMLSATYTPSGKVLFSYLNEGSTNRRDISLATIDDDGKNMQTFFSGKIPEREKDNGIRFMVFADNKRVFMGDFILECFPNLDNCHKESLYPVEYPKEIASGDHISHRWSEMLIAPDNKHVAWTTLFANYSAAIFTGKLEKTDNVYKIVDTRVASTIEAFRQDPKHSDGVLPNPVRNGEVKQFIRGGTAISMVGAINSDVADSVVQDLLSEDLIQITHTPGYDETTIFSPDEHLGIVMSSRFSEQTDLALLGLMPKPYPASLNMGLNMHSYTYSVTGVRKSRSGNVGPALIDIAESKARSDYQGINLNTQDEWVYNSPMSWHPDGKKAMWIEGMRGSERTEGKRRIQVVRLLDYEPKPAVATQSTPDDISYAYKDLSVIEDFLTQNKEIDVKIYGEVSGHIHYRRTAQGAIDKTYVNYSDDGDSIYNGSEKIQLNPYGNSTYRSEVELTGTKAGKMDLQMTFGSLNSELPAKLIFAKGSDGKPLTYGYSEYSGVRLSVDDLIE